MELGLQGKVALITGASKGIGKAIAQEFAQEGASVSICARGQEALGTAAEDLRTHGVPVVATPADVTKPTEVQQVVEATIQKFGRIDVLVNNAGDASLGHTLDTSDDDWRHAMDVNFYSAVSFTQGVVPHMRASGGGRIIHISSAVGHTVLIPGMVDYGTAKAALLAFSRTMAIELAPDNILVNSVCPGFITTPLGGKLAEQAMPMLGLQTPEEAFQFVSQLTLLKRTGTAEEVSALVAFLASERASYITGSVYDVDGGYTKSTI